MLNPRESVELTRLREEDKPELQQQFQEEVLDGRVLEGDFSEQLTKRAALFLRFTGADNEWRDGLRFLRRLTAAALFLAFLLGTLAAAQAFPPLQTQEPVNFFWLLAVLIGLNCLSLLLWLFLVPVPQLLPGSGHSGGTLATQLLQIFASRQWRVSQALADWLKLRGKGRAGTWRFSRLSHLLWLTYLLGGLFMILLMLFTRQFNFIWETTLLDEQTFNVLTNILNGLVAPIGLQGPDLEAIRQSQRGSPAELLASHRTAWAWLLIGTLIMAGLIPRLLLAIFSHYMIRRAESRAETDLADIYFVGLRQSLLPVSHRLGVRDADQHPPPALTARAATGASALPAGLEESDENTLLVGLELPFDDHWHPQQLSGRYLGNLSDRDSRQRILDEIRRHPQQALYVLTDVRRAADRGLGERLRELKQKSSGVFRLLLLIPPLADPEAESSDRRLADWYRLAYACGLEDTQILRTEFSAEDPSP